MLTRSFRYKLGRPIGEGATATVFAGVLQGAGGFCRELAIKRLRSPVDAEAYEQFQREAHICASLTHPNIVSVFDFIRDQQGHLCIIMERVHGVDLATLCRAHAPLAPGLVEYIGSCMLRGLSYAHSRRIVHRDISPGNVLVSWDGLVKLSDFGIARVLEDSDALHGVSVRGTIGYMSPEAAGGQPIDARADLFAAGAIMYQLLTGVSPFRARTIAEALARVMDENPMAPHRVRPEVPQPLSAVTMRLLEKRKQERFQSADQALDALSLPKHGAEDLAALLRAQRPSPLLDPHSAKDTNNATARLPTLARAMAESMRERHSHTLPAESHVPGPDLAAKPDSMASHEEPIPAPRIEPARIARAGSRIYLTLAAMALAIMLAGLVQRAWHTPSRPATPDTTQTSVRPGPAQMPDTLRIPVPPPTSPSQDPSPDTRKPARKPANRESRKPARFTPAPAPTRGSNTAAQAMPGAIASPPPGTPTRRPATAHRDTLDAVEYDIPTSQAANIVHGHEEHVEYDIPIGVPGGKQ